MAYNLHTTKTYDQTKEELAQTFDRWGVTQWEVWPMRGPTGRYFSAAERNVTLKYHLRNRAVTLQMNQQDTPADNLRVLYLAVEAVRMNEVRGVADLVASSYLQLGAPALARDPWEVMGLRPDADRDTIDAVYRAKAKRLHPDAGGDPAAFKALTAAYEEVTRG